MTTRKQDTSSPDERALRLEGEKTRDRVRDVETRLATLEERTKHLATKEDIANTKTWGIVTMVGTGFTILIGLGSLGMLIFRLSGG